MAIATVDPTTGQTLRTFEPHTAEQVEERVARAVEAFRSYRRTSFTERAGWMRVAADLLDADTESLADLMTTEMGKTLAAARAEIGKCAKGCRHYAEHAERYLAEEPIDPSAVGAVRAYARYQPLGPVLAVMPWNFPLWQAMRFAAPALMAGNVGLLKHASNVPQTALYLQELFRRAGFPEGAFSTLLVGSGDVEGIIRDPRVAAVTLTGSTPAGRAVASVAGDVLKPSVLELGGSDPYVVLPSADLEKAAQTAATARCQNNGQSCIAAKRFVVHADVAGRFERLFADALSALTVGDPKQDGVDVGPLATEQGRADVEELVRDAADKGARVVVGGRRLDRPGWFYPPTLVTGVTPQMRMFREEVFGPVAQLHVVGSFEEAVALANDTDFGLGANVWTADGDEAERFAAEVEAGMVAVNGMVASFPELPFGGVKDSGYGRELSAHGIRAFCNVKSVWVGKGGPDPSTARAE